MSFHTGGLVMLSEMLEELPGSEKKIATYILDHPQEAINMTASELGKKSSTSSAAVIRLCKSLDLKGFQELKIRVAGDLQKTEESGFRDIEPDETLRSVTEKMTFNSIQTLRETAEILRTEELEKAVKVLAEAENVHFFGVGASAIIAQDAQQKWLRIDRNAFAFSDVHMAATLVANTKPGDVVCGISFSGQTAEVVNIMELAKSKGATTVSLTKYGSSPVTDVADIRLYTSATKEATFRSGATSSRLAQLHVVDILFMSLASMQYNETITHLDDTRAAIDSIRKY